MNKAKTDTIDIISGPIWKNILFFVWPIMIANILQISFAFADTIIVGNFVSDKGLAAVGTTNPITIFFMWGINGLSLGANVLISRMIGARKYDDVGKAVFNGLLIGFLAGLFISILGIGIAKPLLMLFGTPDDIIADATLYLRIYFLCGIAIGIYDFGAAALRANADTRHPTVFLAISGVLNVALNLLFVVVFALKVAGVAIATLISQSVAALLVLRQLRREEGYLRLEYKKDSFDPAMIRQILKYGIPSALQNQLFSFSNMIIQSSVNSFGSTFVAANTAANAIEEYVYVFVDAFPQASLTFTSQLYGAKEYDRIKKLLSETFIMCGAGAYLIGACMLKNGTALLGLLSDDPEVIRLGLYRLQYVTLFLFINGLLDCVVNSIRGMGLSQLPTIITLIGVVGFRTLYIGTVFAGIHTPEALYLCFPLSWVLTLVLQSIIWVIVYHKTINGTRGDYV